MPYRDGTGPQGGGPMTGRGFGPCLQGRGGFFGRGFGRGWKRGGNWGYFSRPISKNDEREGLESYRKSLEEELEAVKSREKELSQDK